MPDEPAPEHVDQEEEQDRLLQETDGDEKEVTVDKHAEQDRKKRLFMREEELEKGRVTFFVLHKESLSPPIRYVLFALPSSE